MQSLHPPAPGAEKSGWQTTDKVEKAVVRESETPITVSPLERKASQLMAKQLPHILPLVYATKVLIKVHILFLP